MTKTCKSITFFWPHGHGSAQSVLDQGMATRILLMVASSPLDLAGRSLVQSALQSRLAAKGTVEDSLPAQGDKQPKQECLYWCSGANVE